MRETFSSGDSSNSSASFARASFASVVLSGTLPSGPEVSSIVSIGFPSSLSLSSNSLDDSDSDSEAPAGRISPLALRTGNLVDSFLLHIESPDRDFCSYSCSTSQLRRASLFSSITVSKSSSRLPSSEYSSSLVDAKGCFFLSGCGRGFFFFSTLRVRAF